MRVFFWPPLSTRFVASSHPATNHETCFVTASGICVMIFCCFSVGLLPAIYLACISGFVLQPDMSNLAAATVPYAIFSIFELLLSAFFCCFETGQRDHCCPTTGFLGFRPDTCFRLCAALHLSIPIAIGGEEIHPLHFASFYDSNLLAALMDAV